MRTRPESNSPSRWHVGAHLPIVGTALFLSVVIPLHFVQQGYNPRFQLLSELALGLYGWMMLFAFLGLALSAMGVGIISSRTHALNFLSVIWGLAALCFLGAGTFPLGKSDFLHISLIGSAFVLSVLGIYVLARQSSKLVFRMQSYLLAVGMTLSVFLGNTVLDIGIAQRLATLCLLSWFVIIGYQAEQINGGVISP